MGTTRGGLDFAYLFKIILVGDSGVGKTNLLSRYTSGQFTDDGVTTIAIDFQFHSLEVDRGDESGETDRVKLQLWDTAGQDRFKTITRTFYRGSHGVFVVFDLTSRTSFRSVQRSWLSEVRDHCDESAVVYLVGNKSDEASRRCVTYDEAAAWAKDEGLTYIETSAKADEAIDAMFNGMATDLHSVYREAGGNYDKLRDGGRVDVGGGGSSGGNGTRSCCTIL